MKYLSVSKASKALSISPHTLRLYEERGILLPARKVGPSKQRQYTLQQLQEFSIKEWGFDVTKEEAKEPIKFLIEKADGTKDTIVFPYETAPQWARDIKDMH